MSRPQIKNHMRSAKQLSTKSVLTASVMSKEDIGNMMDAYSRKNALAMLQLNKDALANKVLEMERYITQFERKDATDSDKAHTINFAIHYLTANLTAGLRIDLLANAQVDMAMLANRTAANK